MLNGLDQDKDQQNVCPGLGPNCSKVISRQQQSLLASKELKRFLHKFIFKIFFDTLE